MQGWSPAGAQLSEGAGYAGDGSRRAPQNIALLPPAALRYRVPAPKGTHA